MVYNRAACLSLRRSFILKQRFKMYKSGKLWCYAAIMFAAATIGVTDFAENVLADDNITANQQVVTNSVNNEDKVRATDSTVGSENVDSNEASNKMVVNSKTQIKAQNITPVLAAVTKTTPAPAVPVNQQGWDSNATQANAVDLSWMNTGMNEGTFVQLRNQGVKYAIIQLTKGTYQQDAPAAEQIRDAYAAGLGVAAYHFTKFTNRQSAIDEANYFADRADQLNLPSNTLMFADIEDPRNQYAGVANDLRAFFDQLRNRGYWNQGVYTYAYFDSRFHVSDVVGRGCTWIAQYTYDHRTDAGRNWAKHNAGYGAWQYTGYNNGYNVNGYGTIDGDVDLGLLGSAVGAGFNQAANLDSLKLDASRQTLDVSGWFASYDSRGKDAYHYVIVLDNEGHELVRQQVSIIDRPDVANVYRYLYNAGRSGFSASFSLKNSNLATAISNGTPLTIIFRNSASADGNSNYSDHTFSNVSMNENNGSVDGFDVDNGILTVNGWHATNQSMSRNSRWVILYDQTIHREISRAKASVISRPDVARAYPNVYDAVNSGFSAKFKLQNNSDLAAALMNGDQIQVVARYTTNDQNGEGNNIDCWLTPNNLGSAQAANLDTFKLQGQGIQVNGWYAADRSMGASSRYLIVFDQTTGREVARQKVGSTQRADVAKAYPNIYAALQSGFSAEFKLSSYPSLLVAIHNGDRLQVIARYSDQSNGEGTHVDYWFDPQTFNANQASLDQFSLDADHQVITVSGWHCADQAVDRQNQWIILFDQTTHQEVARVKASGQSRLDVKRVYPDIYNSANSGFLAVFKIKDYPNLATALMNNDQLQVVARLTDNINNGEGNNVDSWLGTKQFGSAQAASLDSFKIQDRAVQVSGWFASDRGVGASSRYLIIFDRTTGHEIERQKVTSVSRPDVAQTYPRIYNAGQSGFQTKFNLIDGSSLASAVKNGDQLQVVARYSNQNDGEGVHVDYWFDPRKL